MACAHPDLRIISPTSCARQALDKDQGLEAVHGAEPLHLYTSSYSGCYFFAWDSTLPFSASLRALNIEGNLNRFAAVSSWLERNARIGKLPTEDTVTRAEAAQIDMALLENPALIALKPDDEFGAILDSQQDDGVQASCAWWTSPRKPDVPSPKTRRTARMVPPSEPKAVRMGIPSDNVETIAQHAPAIPLRRGLPMHLQDGNMAIGFTSAGVSMMPSTKYDVSRHAWWI